jgi:hypothetical protein
MSIFCVNVETHDCARRVDAQWYSALVKACAGARDIERSHGAIAGPQEAMFHGKAVVEGSGDRLRLGDRFGRPMRGRDAFVAFYHSGDATRETVKRGNVS